VVPRDRAPTQGIRGAKTPEAEALLVLDVQMKAPNLPTFLQFRNTKISDICFILAKNHGWPRNWGEPEAKLGGLCPPAQA